MDYGGGPGLWPALDALCDAAAGNQSRWKDAEDAAKALGGPTPKLAPCLEQAARALLERALAWHKRNPGRNPAVSDPADGSEPACPSSFKITAALSVDDAMHPIPGTTPTGSKAGGTPFALIGLGMDHPTQVRVAGLVATIVDSRVDPDDLTVTVIVRSPPVTKDQAASISLRNRAGERLAPAPFQYHD